MYTYMSLSLSLYIYIYIYIYVHMPYFKNTVYPFFESDTLFLECLFVSSLVALRFFESRDV